MTNLEYIESLFKRFSLPRVNKEQKSQSRKIIIEELNGYVAEECANYDNRKLKRSPMHPEHTNYNIVTKCENPQYLITAHYDNPNEIYSHYTGYFSRKNGNFNDKISKMKTIAAIVLLFLLFFSSPIGIIYFIFVEFHLKLLGTINNFWLFYFASMFSLMIGLAVLLATRRINYFKDRCKYSADDNTSGVVAALIIAKILKEKNIKNVQFAFFDNEEKGLCGSYSYLKDNNICKDINVINLDTVGRGKRICISGNNNNELRKKIENYLKENSVTYLSRLKSFSDCKSFTNRMYNAFTISRGDVLSIKDKKIIDISWTHTYHDTIDNIDFNRLEEVVNVIIEFIEKDMLEVD